MIKQKIYSKLFYEIDDLTYFSVDNINIWKKVIDTISSMVSKEVQQVDYIIYDSICDLMYY